MSEYFVILLPYTNVYQFLKYLKYEKSNITLWFDNNFIRLFSKR
jgi:hypothetical protein